MRTPTAAIPLPDANAQTPTIGVWVIARGAKIYQSVCPSQTLIDALPHEHERQVDEYVRHEKWRLRQATPPPPIPEPIQVTCMERKLDLGRTFAENGITEGAKLTIQYQTSDCPGWYNEAERMELALEGLQHHRKRTWTQATEVAASACLHHSGAHRGPRK